MSLSFEELDNQQTPLGNISLRRRAEPRLAWKTLYEVKLGNDFLMSSLFTEGEIQLACLGLAALDGKGLDIVVGGLGLGFTAAAALEDPRVKSLGVIELMKPVIDWHRRGLVPLGEKLFLDTRCNIIQDDFFALALSESGFEGKMKISQVDGIFLDIDHSPSHWLNSDNQKFYTKPGLASLANKLHPGGVFGLWSNDPPDDQFTELLDTVFESSQAHIVNFSNPYSGAQSSNTVYLARKSSSPA
jgi:spermidine synthase